MKATMNNAKQLLRCQKGITGLETAIVLIAFVVVSSVFAFAALSTGLFTSDKSKETIQAGLAEARGTLEVKGDVIANSTLTAVTAQAVGTGDGADTTFTLTSSPVIPGSQTIYVAAAAKTYGTDYSMDFDTGAITFTAAPANGAAITADYTWYVVTAVKVTLANAAGGQAIDVTPGQTIATYIDPDTISMNITNFTTTKINADADNLLEAGEFFEVSVDVSSNGLTDGDQFILGVKPPTGAVLNVNRTIPATVATVMNLH
ncbi:MAG: DUF2460 domain-containing protein [Chloroflexi bacterium]|nr:DUF2460 domain-containing protein [Chloroflexota bacterium]